MNDKMQYRIVQQSTRSEWDLHGPIEDYDHYSEFITQLGVAQEGDIMVLRISSPGGHADVGFMLVKAIMQTKATVVAHVVWPSASMASIIALACHALIFDEYTSLMFHTYSGGSWGKSDDLLQDVLETHWALDNNAKKIICPFLTPAEVQRMQEGKDIYIRNDDKSLQKRIKRHFKLQEAVQ
jgi:ATP-dependent protease ClpP protease subunit